MRSDKTRMPPGGMKRMLVPRNASSAADAGEGGMDASPTVGRRVDALEMERSHKRISEPAYRAGQAVQATFGRLSGCKGDVGAKTVQQMVAAIQDRIGMVDMRLLQRILIDRLSFTECAALQGKSGDRGQNYVAHRFRDALEDLAGAWTNEMVALAAKISATAAVKPTHTPDG